MENLSTVNFFADFPGREKGTECAKRKKKEARTGAGKRLRQTKDKREGEDKVRARGRSRKPKRQRAVYSAERKDSCLSGSTSRVL